jgi:sodium transport system permease protein
VTVLRSHDRLALVEDFESGLLAVEALDAGQVDVVLDFETAANAGGSTGVLIFDGARERSRNARLRIEGVLEDYRSSALMATVRSTGIPPSDIQQFWIEQDNVASDREMGGYFLGLFVPTFMIVMIGVGAMYPAVDATAGERELSTWETLLTTAVSRRNIVIAKYLYVATMSLTAGLLNLTTMSLTLGGLIDALAVDADFRVVLPLGGVFVILIGTALLALFIAAGMMLLASFARTFREGQSLVGPFYLAIFFPVLFLQSPSAGLTPALALVPLVNVALMIREAVAGLYQWPLIGLTLLVEALSVAVALMLATRILKQEGFLLGATEGKPLARLWKQLFPRAGKETA